MKKYIRSSQEFTDRQYNYAKRVYKAAQNLLDAFEDLPTGTIDKLGDIGEIYQLLIDDIPGLHYILFDDNFDDEIEGSTNVEASTGSKKYRYKLEKPSLRNYYFSGDVDEDRFVFSGQITKLAPYDDAEYFWAKIEPNGQVKYIHDGKIVDKAQLWSYDPDDYEDYGHNEGFYEYLEQVFESVATDLKEFNQNIELRMVHN